MDYTGMLLAFAGGLGMFIYGMQIMALGLENTAGGRMKSLLEILTQNKILGVFLGALITAVIQSSSAATVMTVGFVNAGIMNLTQAMSVIMGANIGTTVTGWLVSSVEWAKFLSPGLLAPAALMVGVIIMLTGKRRSTKDAAGIVIGFGLLFVGITTMSDAVLPLKDSAVFRKAFALLGKNPLLGILSGAVVTAIVQSSSASIGILQSLAAAGFVPFRAAVYIIMGQNIGTCVTTMLSGIGARKTAKTAALMHLLFNVIGTAVFGAAAIFFFAVIRPQFAAGNITRTQISLVHTVFNIATTILLFPLSGQIIRLARKLEHTEEEKEKEKGKESGILLDERMLETPGIALQSAVKEVQRMGQAVAGSLKKAQKILFTGDYQQILEIQETEGSVDTMCAGITGYLIRLSTLTISEKEHQQIAQLLQVLSDMERIGDYCEDISEFAQVLHERKETFSEMGDQQMQEMLQVCADCYYEALEAFEKKDREMAFRVIEKERKADELEQEFRGCHVKRLANMQCSVDAGMIFLDVLGCLERISDHARNIAEMVAEG